MIWDNNLRKWLVSAHDDMAATLSDDAKAISLQYGDAFATG